MSPQEVSGYTFGFGMLLAAVMMLVARSGDNLEHWARSHGWFDGDIVAEVHGLRTITWGLFAVSTVIVIMSFGWFLFSLHA